MCLFINSFFFAFAIMESFVPFFFLFLAIKPKIYFGLETVMKVKQQDKCKYIF